MDLTVEHGIAETRLSRVPGAVPEFLRASSAMRCIRSRQFSPSALRRSLYFFQSVSGSFLFPFRPFLLPGRLEVSFVSLLLPGFPYPLLMAVVEILRFMCLSVPEVRVCRNRSHCRRLGGFGRVLRTESGTVYQPVLGLGATSFWTMSGM